MRTGDPVRAVHFMRTQFVSYENTIREPARERRAQFTIRSSHHRRVPILLVLGAGGTRTAVLWSNVIKRHTRPRFRNSGSETNDEGLNWTSQESTGSTLVTDRRRNPSCIAEIFWCAPPELGCDFFIAGCHKWMFGPAHRGAHSLAQPAAQRGLGENAECYALHAYGGRVIRRHRLL